MIVESVSLQKEAGLSGNFRDSYPDSSVPRQSLENRGGFVLTEYNFYISFRGKNHE
jgi:hypothetical protein